MFFSFRIRKGNNFLVLLIPGDKEEVKLRPDCVSLVPLSGEAVSLVDENLTPEQNVERLLAKGCEEESLRGLSVYLLSQFHTTSAMQFLARYVNDKDDTIADDALTNFARNQQVSAIPMIVARAKSFPFGASVPLISRYKVKEAKPFLEKAMFGYPSGIRLNSVMALSNMAKKDSVPFLLLALYDQDPQKFVAPYSCAVLHKVLLEVPNNFNPDQYEEQKTRERQLFFSWWQDELSGKHPANADEKPAVELRQLQKFEASDLPQLNLGLFMKSETTRRAAARGLEQFADQSSIPYLLIALYDPVPDVAYSAYATLHRIVPALGVATSRAQWNAQRETQTKLAFDWWQQQLIDADKPPKVDPNAKPEIR